MLATEYSLSRSLESTYKGRLVQFAYNPSYLIEMGVGLCGLLNYRPPAFLAMPRKELAEGYHGLYIGYDRPTQRGCIYLAPTADQITIIHELAHHLTFIENRPCHTPGITETHGADFIAVEAMLLRLLISEEAKYSLSKQTF